MKLDQAKILAEEVKAILTPYTSRIEIAGGVRRGKLEPHDLEIVCVPKFDILELLDVWGNTQPTIRNMLDDEIKIGTHFQKGNPDKAGKKAPNGPKYYRLRYKGEGLDIFAVMPPAHWGTVYLIRTGDADFSHKFVYRLWDYSLKSVEGHIESNEGKTLDTPEEIDAFKLCHLDYIEPEKRNASAIP